MVSENNKVAVVTLGCARNEVDSEEMAGRLAANGWELVDDPENADAVLVNTCGFVEVAKKDSIDAILAVSDLKDGSRGPRAVVAVGCLAERYGRELADSLPEADAVLGFDDYPDIGETLVWDGDGAQYSYVITRGALRASKTSDDGRRQILDFLFSGQFVGIPSDAAYHFDVEALIDSEVCRFDKRKLEHLMAKHPSVEKGYRTGAARQLENAYEHAYALGRRTAMERVAAFLLDLRASRCAKSATGVLKLPMTRSDIADFLGLTLETVSRAFSRLKSLGVIRLASAQEVEIRDAERLKALAGSAAL